VQVSCRSDATNYCVHYNLINIRRKANKKRVTEQ
jgi:hypothetical protein